MKMQKIFLIFVFAFLLFSLSFGVGEVFEITFYSEEDMNNAIVPVFVDTFIITNTTNVTFKINPADPSNLRYQNEWPVFFVEMNVRTGKNTLYLINSSTAQQNTSLIEYTYTTQQLTQTNYDFGNLTRCQNPNDMYQAQFNISAPLFRNLSRYETIIIKHFINANPNDQWLFNYYNNTPWGPTYSRTNTPFPGRYPSFSFLSNKTRLVSFFYTYSYEGSFQPSGVLRQYTTMPTCANYLANDGKVYSCQSNYSRNVSETLRLYCFFAHSDYQTRITFYATNKIPKIYTRKNEKTIYLNGIQLFKASKENNYVASVPFFIDVTPTSEVNRDVPLFKRLFPFPPQTPLSFYYPISFYPFSVIDIGSTAGTVALNYVGNIICAEKIVISPSGSYNYVINAIDLSTCNLRVGSSSQVQNRPVLIFDYDTCLWYFKPAVNYNTIPNPAVESIFYYSNACSQPQSTNADFGVLPLYVMCRQINNNFTINAKYMRSVQHFVTIQFVNSSIQTINATGETFNFTRNLANVSSITYSTMTDLKTKCYWTNATSILNLPDFTNILPNDSRNFIKMTVGVSLGILSLALTSVISPTFILAFFAVNDFFKLVSVTDGIILGILGAGLIVVSRWAGEKSLKALLSIFAYASAYVVFISTNFLSSLPQSLQNVQTKITETLNLFSSADLTTFIFSLPFFLVNVFTLILTLPVLFWDAFFDVIVNIDQRLAFVSAFKIYFIVATYGYIVIKAYEIIANRFRTV